MSNVTPLHKPDRNELVGGDMFIRPREPEEIMAEAMEYRPCAIFACFSGGTDSLVSTHWAMTNIPNCEVLHINTGIGIEETREFVRGTCIKYGWPLTEIRAKENCGQDYRDIVLAHGFPGPSQHIRMFIQLKERAIAKLTRDRKRVRSDRIVLLTGVHHEESQNRMGYASQAVARQGARVWVNHLYFWPKSRFFDYLKCHDLRRNPVSEVLGMSGECLCGAFAHKGEKALIRIVSPETADRIEALEKEVWDAGHHWGWEDPGPPKVLEEPSEDQMFMPFCMGCEKLG